MMALDNLKDVWNNQGESKIQFSEIDLYKMIHKKSTSIVKWIFYISILEFVILIIPTFFLDTSEAESEMGIVMFTKVLNIINFGIIMPLFIFLFYKNYKAISVDDTSKKLMKGILKTKKTVSYYVLTQITLAAILTFEILYKVTKSETFIDQMPENINMVVVWGVFSFFIAFILLIIWLFYKLLYGILLHKLKNNYKELIAKENKV